MERFEIAATECGKVRGLFKTSALNTEYISFQGIPYMKAPLGKLRFRDAEEPEKWSDVFDATGEAFSYCTHNLIAREFEGREDASIINVFTKNLSPPKLYPVMVWIHGGSFRYGSSKTDVYGPDFLLQKDVIVVSFNYRLGVFGFLSLDDEDLNIPGNAALKDQIFALKWIKKNIKNFGGDPDNVTLFGESAGAGSIHFLAISDLAKGLFHRAIIMSGSAFCKRWSLVPRQFARKYNVALARQLGWRGRARNEKELLNVLENASPLALMDAHNVIVNDEDIFAYGVLTSFGPVIEPYQTDNCLIYKDPIDMARDAWSKDIEFFITANSFEGLVRANTKEELANYYLQDPVNFFPFLELDLDNTDEKAIEYGERIKKLYYGDKQPRIENQYEYLQYQSEYLVWHGVYRAVQSRLKYSNKNTFLLRFHVDTAHNFFKFILQCGLYKGAGHADELTYLFKMAFLPVPPEDSKEFKAIERMVAMFTSFATNGNPNCPEIQPAEFHQQNFKPDQLKCIQITEDDVIEIDLPELPKLKVWNSIFDDCNVPLY